MARLALEGLSPTKEARDGADSEPDDNEDEGLAEMINTASLSSSAQKRKDTSDAGWIGGVSTAVKGLIFGKQKQAPESTNVSRNRSTSELDSPAATPTLTPVKIPTPAMGSPSASSDVAQSVTRPPITRALRRTNFVSADISKQRSNGRGDVYEPEESPETAEALLPVEPAKKGKAALKPKETIGSKAKESVDGQRQRSPETENHDEQDEDVQQSHKTNNTRKRKTAKSPESLQSSPLGKRATRSTATHLIEPTDNSRVVEKGSFRRASVRTGQQVAAETAKQGREQLKKKKAVHQQADTTNEQPRHGDTELSNNERLQESQNNVTETEEIDWPSEDDLPSNPEKAFEKKSEHTGISSLETTVVTQGVDESTNDGNYRHSYESQSCQISHSI